MTQRVVLFALVVCAAIGAVTAAPLVAPTWSWDADTTYRHLFYADAASRNDSIAPGNWTCDYCSYYTPASLFLPTHVFYNEPMQSYGYMGYNPVYREIALVLRGSAVLENFITDLKSMKKVPYPFASPSETLYVGSVGEGFLQYWTSLRDRMLLALDAMLINPVFANYHIVVIGHSLGGSAAALAGVDVARRHGRDRTISVTTFGEPRTGDQYWVNYQHSMMGGAITRVTNNADPVPHLPLQLEGFQHELREVWERSKNSYVVTPQHPNFGGLPFYTVCSASDPEDPFCSDSLVDPKDWILWNHNNYMGVPLGKAGPTGNPSGYKVKVDKSEL